METLFRVVTLRQRKKDGCKRDSARTVDHFEGLEVLKFKKRIETVAQILSFFSDPPKSSAVLDILLNKSQKKKNLFLNFRLKLKYKL